jgi:hypothetical protein
LWQEEGRESKSQNVWGDSQEDAEGDSEVAEKKEEIENEILGELGIERNRKERKRDPDESEEFGIGKNRNWK